MKLNTILACIGVGLAVLCFVVFKTWILVVAVILIGVAHLIAPD